LDETEKKTDIEATSLSLNSQNVETGQPMVATIGMKDNGTADGIMRSGCSSMAPR
jgi:hypothetical protein